MGMSQMCTGAGDYFRTSKPHSEKLCSVFGHLTQTFSQTFMVLRSFLGTILGVSDLRPQIRVDACVASAVQPS